MQPSPSFGPPQTPQLFEDTSTYAHQQQPPPRSSSTPYLPAAPQNDIAPAPPVGTNQQSGGWQSYDMDMMADYAPPQQTLPPYDPFGQQQQQQHGYAWTNFSYNHDTNEFISRRRNPRTYAVFMNAVVPFCSS